MSTPRRNQSSTPVKEASQVSGSTLERAVFNALLQNASSLGLSELNKCNGLWADLNNGTKVVFEIKSTLSWSALSTGVFQLLSLNSFKTLGASEGWLIYERISDAWRDKNQEKPLQEAWHCLSAIHSCLPIRLCELQSNGQLTVHKCQAKPLIITSQQ